MNPIEYKGFVIRRFLDPETKIVIYIAIPKDVVGVHAPTLREIKEYIRDAKT